MSWELLNLISKPATFDALEFAMSCGEERGGVGSTHLPAVTTDLLQLNVWVRHDTNTMALDDCLDGLRYP